MGATRFSVGAEWAPRCTSFAIRSMRLIAPPPDDMPPWKDALDETLSTERQDYRTHNLLRFNRLRIACSFRGRASRSNRSRARAPFFW